MQLKANAAYHYKDAWALKDLWICTKSNHLDGYIWMCFFIRQANFCTHQEKYIHYARQWFNHTFIEETMKKGVHISKLPQGVKIIKGLKPHVFKEALSSMICLVAEKLVQYLQSLFPPWQSSPFWPTKRCFYFWNGKPLIIKEFDYTNLGRWYSSRFLLVSKCKLHCCCKLI